MKKMLLFLTPLALLNAFSLFADEAVQGRENNMWQTFIMIGLALVFFYFILFRPEQKRRKKMEKQRSSLQKGDRVTAMGIVGTVARIESETVILKMVDGAKIEVIKGAISDVQPSGDVSLKEEETSKEAT